MDIQDYRAMRIDASCNYMNIEFGVPDGKEDRERIGCDGRTAYGRYLQYIIRRDAVNGGGNTAFYLGILPNKTVEYLVALDHILNENRREWRPNSPTLFRKLMLYARKMEKLEIKVDDDTFPVIEKWFKEYSEIKNIEKIAR
jgi:hypothetical protein